MDTVELPDDTALYVSVYSFDVTFSSSATATILSSPLTNCNLLSCDTSNIHAPNFVSDVSTFTFTVNVSSISIIFLSDVIVILALAA